MQRRGWRTNLQALIVPLVPFSITCNNGKSFTYQAEIFHVLTPSKFYTLISSIPGSRLVLVLYLQKCTSSIIAPFVLVNCIHAGHRWEVMSSHTSCSMPWTWSVVLQNFIAHHKLSVPEIVSTKIIFVSFFVHELEQKNRYEKDVSSVTKKEIDMAVFAVFAPDVLWVFLITQYASAIGRACLQNYLPVNLSNEIYVMYHLLL